MPEAQFDETSRPVRDPSTLKALSHPVRLRLLTSLGELGKANVARLATSVSEPANAVSYHLRILAREGLIADAEPPADATGREHWWQLTNPSGTQIRPSEIEDESVRLGLMAALDTWYHHRQAQIADRLLASVAGHEEADLEGLMIDLSLVLPDDEAARMRQELRAVVEQWVPMALAQRTEGRMLHGPRAGEHVYRLNLQWFADTTITPAGTPTPPGVIT